MQIAASERGSEEIEMCSIAFIWWLAAIQNEKIIAQHCVRVFDFIFRSQIFRHSIRVGIFIFTSSALTAQCARGHLFCQVTKCFCDSMWPMCEHLVNETQTKLNKFGLNTIGKHWIYSSSRPAADGVTVMRNKQQFSLCPSVRAPVCHRT